MTTVVKRLRPSREHLQADLDAISGVADPDARGWNRRVLSELYRASRDWVADRMRETSFEVYRDSAGTSSVFGRAGGPVLPTGSQTDRCGLLSERRRP